MRILALRALGLGDLLTAVPALRALQELGNVTVAAPAALAPLIELIGCEHLVAQALEPLPPRNPDLLVNLHGRGPQSHRAALAARPRRFIAFAHPEVPVTDGGPEWRADEHEVQRWCRLLTESGIPADPTRLALPDPACPLPVDAPGATVIHPGAASGARRWPAARFAQIARAEARRGHRVLITGSSGERALAQDVARRAGLHANTVLAGRTDLLQLASVVARAARVVCGDTGVAHLATAFDTPSVLLFGPTSPEAWGPPPRPLHRVLWTGGTGDPHAAEPDPGLLEIAPADVLGELALLPT